MWQQLDVFSRSISIEKEIWYRVNDPYLMKELTFLQTHLWLSPPHECNFTRACFLPGVTRATRAATIALTLHA